MAASASDDAMPDDDVFASLNDENRERSAFSTSSTDNVFVDFILLVGLSIGGRASSVWGRDGGSRGGVTNEAKRKEMRKGALWVGETAARARSLRCMQRGLIYHPPATDNNN